MERQPAGEGDRPFSGILANLAGGIRAALLRPVGTANFRGTPTGFALLAFFDLLLQLVLSLARIGFQGQFSLLWLPSTLIHVPLMLCVGLGVARLARRDDAGLDLATVFLAVAIPVELLAELFGSLPEEIPLPDFLLYPGFDHYYPFFGWWVLACLVALFRLAPMPLLRRGAALLLFSALLIVPLWSLERGELWQAAGDGGEAEKGGISGGEDAFYRQPLLLDSALAQVTPGRSGVEELYFIGFAGYGGQGVFRRELESIAGLVTNRFDAAGRSLLLVNNPDTVRIYPIATATSLERALKRVGRVMNRDEDILLLYLTSHGSEDHHLEAELQPFSLRDIEPAMLKRMLDDSGIRWRVVVVSACYSGAFVDALKGDGTLVMTASDASSSSFGCSNDSDFTWFGKALFDEELRNTHSFAAAFAGAARSIAARERSEGVEPSRPQISLGKGIASRLGLLERRLDRLERKGEPGR